MSKENKKEKTTEQIIDKAVETVVKGVVETETSTEETSTEETSTEETSTEETSTEETSTEETQDEESEETQDEESEETQDEESEETQDEETQEESKTLAVKIAGLIVNNLHDLTAFGIVLNLPLLDCDESTDENKLTKYLTGDFSKQLNWSGIDSTFIGELKKMISQLD